MSFLPFLACAAPSLSPRKTYFLICETERRGKICTDRDVLTDESPTTNEPLETLRRLFTVTGNQAKGEVHVCVCVRGKYGGKSFLSSACFVTHLHHLYFSASCSDMKRVLEVNKKQKCKLNNKYEGTLCCFACVSGSLYLD